MDYCCISAPLPSVILASFYKESDRELQTLHAPILNSLLVTRRVLLRLSCISYFSPHILHKIISLHRFELMDAKMYPLQEAPFQVFVAFPDCRQTELSSAGFSCSAFPIPPRWVTFQAPLLPASVFHLTALLFKSTY